MQQPNLKLQKIVSYSLAASVFFLPLKAQLASVFIILALLASLLNVDWKNFSSDLKKNKFFLFSIAYFVMHLIGMCYSTNLDYGFKDIQTKLSFLIFPMLFIFHKPDLISIDLIKKSFIAGCMVALIICITEAFMDFRLTHNTDVFFYSKFSRFLHTTYFEFYINFAIILLLDIAYSKREVFKTGFLVPFFLAELFLFTGLFLLSARMSLLTTVFTVIIFIIVKALQQKEKRKLTVAIAVSFLIASGIQYELISLNNRFTQVETTIQNEKKITAEIKNNTAVTEEYNSTTSRLALWKYATELITSTPTKFIFGVGTGDIKEELREVYIKNNFQKGIDENYNPHNQFLHTAVVIGIIGLLLLLLLLLSPLITAIKKNNIVLVTFIVIILLNGLTESILEVQSGIIFFCFFYCLIISEMNSKPGFNKELV